MSTKQQTFEPGVMMTCDAPGMVRCARQVRRAPRIVVPHKDRLAPNMPAIRIMTTLHYCDAHAHCFDPADWLTDANKAKVEDCARRFRQPGFRPDFEAVQVEPVLVTTPEYRRFMAYLGIDDVAA